MSLFLTSVRRWIARRLWLARNASACPVDDQRHRTLYVDVSIIANHDARTGIQRVVRGILGALIDDSGAFELSPVAVSPTKGLLKVEISSDDQGMRYSVLDSEPVTPRNGDVLFCLDLNSLTLPSYESLISRWKQQGVTVAYVCYDLLPLFYPEFFTARSRRRFLRWLDLVFRTADRVYCISATVSAELKMQAERRGQGLSVRTIGLGGDWQELGHRPAVTPALQLPGSSSDRFLMVGTIEPRKGYDTALDAFDKLWEEGFDGILIIVGKIGWKCDDLVERIQTHSQFGRQLFWYKSASDTALASLYSECQTLIIASRAEGYCLPYDEAVGFGLDIIANDLPPLRERQFCQVKFFDGTAKSLSSMLISHKPSPRPHTTAQLKSWRETTDFILRDISATDANSERAES